MKAGLLITEPPRARRSRRFVSGSVERNNLAPSDTLLGMEQRLEQADRQRDYDREHITVTGGEWIIKSPLQFEYCMWCFWRMT